MAYRIGIGSTAKIGENLAQPFPSVKKDTQRERREKSLAGKRLLVYDHARL
jgi:hypothetical protein